MTIVEYTYDHYLVSVFCCCSVFPGMYLACIKTTTRSLYILIPPRLFFWLSYHIRQVTINAVENSASVASLVLTTECLIAEIPVEVSEAQQQANYDAMGGGDYM